MEVALEEQTQKIATHLVETGRFPSTDALINEAIRLVQERERKLAMLRATIQASIDEGGECTIEELDDDLDQISKELEIEFAKETGAKLA